jgi:hypothetical protein
MEGGSDTVPAAATEPPGPQRSGRPAAHNSVAR